MKKVVTKQMKGKGKVKRLIVFIVFLAYLLSPLAASFRSMLVMLPYSYLQQRKSLLAEEGIKLKIPAGISTLKRDWYPLLLTFNDDKGMSDYLGYPVRFTVLYSFGHYDLLKARSSYYDRESPYFSSFYGGYIIRPEDPDQVFAFKDDGSVNADDLSKITSYDQLELVISSLGCPPEKLKFESSQVQIQDDVDYLGIGGWTLVNSNISSNSPEHKYESFKYAYIQYGRPRGIKDLDEDFPLVKLRGRVYARYFKEYQATIVLFIMGPSWATIEECDKMILSKTTIGR